MPRPQKCRKICGYPDYWSFSPDEGSEEAVILTLDEYEVIRLIDWVGHTQEEAAVKMQVARTTVTAIYDAARKKIADALVNGKKILISGGNYRFEETKELENLIKKGNNVMRVAVTYEKGEIFQHFGHSEQFKFYDIEDDKVVNEQIVDTNGSGHGALAGFLKQSSVDNLICGGIGGGAQMAMKEAGIKLYAGISGSADEAVKMMLSGSLSENSAATCNYHHGEEHKCGEHGCGSHNHGGSHCH